MINIFSVGMVNPELIQLAITSALLNKDADKTLKHDWQGKKLLVTTGATIEALDSARLITNRSSGLMGVLLAQAARFRGAQVDLIHGPLQLSSSLLDGLNTHPVSNSEEMRRDLASFQASADAVAMAAAVADIRRKSGASSE